jgi:hypothetical protein
MASSIDDGFPILRRGAYDEGMRVVGYIGVGELEHALSLCNSLYVSKKFLLSLT